MQDENTLRDVAKDCVHCGFCLPACPTYQLWAEEMDSPRGRIYLVNQILDGAELSTTAAEHFDRCLGCMACMTACPSGVQYDQLIEAARVWTEEARSGADAGNDSAASAPAVPRVPPGGKRPVRERAARAGAAVDFQCCSIFGAALAEGSYDLVYDSGCFHHLPPHRRRDYVALVRAVLKPGGRYGLVCDSGFHDAGQRNSTPLHAGACQRCRRTLRHQRHLLG